ncbi:sporulation protein Cse60 [Domibacillus robiginosus]|uniref:sporulation protein Cse60 n=1 Tax=Domibacillus robiginosus TaxID=1071054 RepID=UPI00067D41F0|nr:sporulation protein Cse60 [Domibacillus robiginosus]
MNKRYYSVKSFESNTFDELTRNINLFIYHQLCEGQLIDIKYNIVPLSTSTHKETEGQPNIHCTALVIYKNIVNH